MILSLPRSGSTTLARLLNTHSDVKCLIEPFHPMRYGGTFHRTARLNSMHSALLTIWNRWNGIKHVSEADGWPFHDRPELNDQMISGPVRRFVLLVRRNHLRRVVSNILSRRLQFWIGSRAEFLTRLEHARMPALSPERIRMQIEKDQVTIANWRQAIKRSNVPSVTIDYEDWFREDTSESQRWCQVNSLLEVLNYAPVTADVFNRFWSSHFDPHINRWASVDVYRRIPNIDSVEENVGCDATGWLFR